MSTKKSAGNKKAVVKERAVVVCTDKRGVFFGYTAQKFEPGMTATLKRARMCVYWSSDVRGVLGLAATGPSASSRVTPAVPSADFGGVTALIECDGAAVSAWEAGPWRS